MKILIILLLTAFVCQAEPLDPNFLHALNQVETGGKTGAILGDGGKALGPFQIHKAYWQDAGVEGKYEQCADYDYAVKVVTAYLNRYGKKFVETHDYEALARIHNSGPNWRKKVYLTNAYWLKVKKALEYENNNTNKRLSSDNRR